MDKAFIIFSRNRDKKTVNLIVNGFIIDEDVPYIPAKATDHRGLALFYYCKENGIGWNDVQLDEITESPSEVQRGFEYLEGGTQKEVLFAIEERLKQPFNYISKSRK